MYDTSADAIAKDNDEVLDESVAGNDMSKGHHTWKNAILDNFAPGGDLVGTSDSADKTHVVGDAATRPKMMAKGAFDEDVMSEEEVVGDGSTTHILAFSGGGHAIECSVAHATSFSLGLSITRGHDFSHSTSVAWSWKAPIVLGGC